MDLNQIQFIH